VKKPFFIFFIWGVVLGFATVAPAAGIPVVDATNVAQTTISAIENVNQTVKQIEQYTTQLRQYERQLLDAANPNLWHWDDADAVMTQLIRSLDQLAYYKSQLGSIDNYLDKFLTTEDYVTQFADGLDDYELEQIRQAERLSNESNKRAADALIRSIDQQQQNLADDAYNLQRLQSMAQGSTGQMQALQYANQLASHQSQQLMEIRAALLAQQNVMATQAHYENMIKAQQRAASEKVLSTHRITSPRVDWSAGK
jgi:P-type conjugative transfer protein TrbJ